jgi:predicted DsbA family dithiol-disulfide isomerase
MGDSKPRLGNLAGGSIPQGQEPTWHESLLGYCGGDERRRAIGEEGVRELGRHVGIELNFDVKTNWQPVNSQRVMLWAHRFGQQEAFMSALARKHFEHQTSASHDATLLACAEEAGLDVDSCRKFLASDELLADVWKSYGDTIAKGIHAIPLFIFNSPATDGGPFRSGRGQPEIEHGSGNPDRFLQIFERLLSISNRTLATI